MANIKEPIIHKDIFGRQVNVDDVVLVSSNNGFDRRLKVGIVKKINPKMINILPVGSKKIDRRYSNELLVVTDDPRVSAYMLINAGKPIPKRLR